MDDIGEICKFSCVCEMSCWQEQLTYKFSPVSILWQAYWSNIKCISKVQSNMTCWMFCINKMFLHCFFQRHVSAVATSHFQVDHLFLCKANHTICNAMLLLLTRSHVTYTGCPRRNVPDFGKVFLMLKYTDITQNTYIQSWTVTEIMAREVWNSDSCYTLIDYQIHIKTGRNMWFL